MPKMVIQELMRKYGDLNDVIPPMVNEHGQSEAARNLNVSQSTISDWLRANGYERKVIYVKHKPEKRAREESEAEKMRQLGAPVLPGFESEVI